MKIKKITSMFMLGITALSAMPQSAYATDTNLESNIEKTYNEDYIQVYGKVSDIYEDGRILIKNTNNENDEILLNIYKDTVIVDGVSGVPVSVEDIKKEQGLYIYIGQEMTLSLPPMTNAKVIIVNVPEDTKAPTYIKVKSINKNDDGTTTILSQHERYKATFDDNTNVFPYKTRNIVTVEDIKVGSNLLLWEDINPDQVKTLELPERIEVSKCMVMPEDEVKATLEIQKSGWIKENDNWYYKKDNNDYKGWLKDNNKWYYLDNSGVMKTGWIKDNGKWYYLNEDGSMKTGWLLEYGNYYYLKSNGEMASDEYIGGYYLSSNGKWVK